MAVERALESLVAERDRLRTQLDRLDAAISLLKESGGRAAGRQRRGRTAEAPRRGRKRNRRPRSDEQKRAQSERMKAWWAARRGEAAQQATERPKRKQKQAKARAGASE